MAHDGDDEASGPTPVGPVTTRLSEYISTALKRPLPPAVTEKAKHHILDTIAAMVSGSQLAPGKAALRYVKELGGTREATVAGERLVTNAVNAALANGMSAHADETDDSHPASLSHPGCAVVPAALAMAERTRANGRAFLRAVVLGYDMCARVMLALTVDHIVKTSRSSHAIGSLFGAAAAAGALARLNPTQARHLISYTVQQASGVYCWVRDGGHIEKAFDFGGMPARNGVAAATMVKSGMTAVEDSLSGEHNFFLAFSPQGDPNQMVDGLGERYEILNTNIKKWSVGSPAQPVLDALEILVNEHKLKPQDIERVEVTMPENAAWVVRNREMPDVCVEHLAAVMMLDRTVSFDAAHDYKRMKNPAILALRRKVEIIPDKELKNRQAIVAVHTKGGGRLSHHTLAVRGTTRNPMTPAEVDAKADGLMSTVLGKAKSRKIVAAVRGLEQVADLRRLRPLLQRG